MMFLNLRFAQPCPDGMEVLGGRVEVSGIRHRRGDANAFARGSGHRLEFVVEPGDRHVSSAVRVVGVTRGWLFDKRRFLGYVPQGTVAELARRGLSGAARPRLRHIWAAEDGYVVVRFDVLVPR